MNFFLKKRLYNAGKPKGFWGAVTLGNMNKEHALLTDGGLSKIDVKPDAVCLDIGCGGGILSEALARENAQVTGIDLATQALEAAERHARTSGLAIRYLNISAEKLAQAEPAHYDIVTCMELLEHVPDPGAIVHACAQLLKPGGIAIFATLNRNLTSWCHAIIGAEYIMHLLPKGTHQFNKFITPSELARHIRTAGMTVSAITGVTCDLSARHFHLSANTRVNYMLACIKPF